MQPRVTLSGLLILLAGCPFPDAPHVQGIGGGGGGGGGGGNGGGVTASVTIQDFSFSPADVTIQAGGTVTWTNNGPSSHTVTANGGSFESSTLGPPGGGATRGGSYSKTFPTAGTFAYHCSIHPNMTGTITVQ